MAYKRRGRLTPAGRRAISEMMKARWAAKREGKAPPPNKAAAKKKGLQPRLAVPSAGINKEVLRLALTALRNECDKYLKQVG